MQDESFVLYAKSCWIDRGGVTRDTGRVRVVSRLLLVLLMIAPMRAYAADATREFVTSCVYGSIAGTLVGVASLAFTSQPGENLRNVARGASLGLYAGILLGAYVTQMVPDGDEPPPPQIPVDEPPPVPPGEEGMPPEARFIRPGLNLVLNPETRRVDGVLLTAALTFY